MTGRRRKPRRPSEILWSARAKDDLTAIGDYIAADNPAAAMRWVLCGVPAVWANTAVPIGGLPELAAMLVLTAGLFIVALILTIRRFTPRSGGTVFFVVLVFLGALANTIIAVRFMADEWRPESFSDYWTGVGYWIPLLVSAIAVGVAFLRMTSRSPTQQQWRWRRFLVWAIPSLLWMLAWIIPFLSGSFQAHI